MMLTVLALAAGVTNIVVTSDNVSSDGAFVPLLFMDMNDTSDAWGLIEPSANTVVPNHAYAPPHAVDYAGGALVIAVLASVRVHTRTSRVPVPLSVPVCPSNHFPAPVQAPVPHPSPRP